MLNVNLDRSQPLALYEQVASALRRAIANGEAGPGDRLPPAKDLAGVLGVNNNTVLRALRELRDEGVLEFRRGRGVTVIATPGHSTLIAASHDLLRLAERHGYRRDELLTMIAALPIS